MNTIKRILCSAVVLALLAVPMGFTVLSATPVKAPPKAPVKTPVKPPVKGTQQLDGTQAQFGLTYTLGISNPINVQLISAEYTVVPVNIGTDFFVPTGGEKLLIIRYLLHNPNKTDYPVNWGSLTFTAIDSTDTNYLYCQYVGMENDSSKASMDLKPGQKVKLFTVVKVPAKSDIPKLLIEDNERKVLRYNLQKQGNPSKPIVKPLSTPYADPADPKGYTALSAVPAQMGTFYRYNALEVRVDGTSFTTSPIQEQEPMEGHRYLNIMMTYRNIGMEPYEINWGTLTPNLVDADGMELEWAKELLAANRDMRISQVLNPKAEIRVRTAFQVPDGVPLGQMTLRMDEDSRQYVYGLMDVK